MSTLAASGDTPEYLFWVGCAGSFDSRAQRITQAMVKILNHLEISYAVLGQEESCTGDPPSALGMNPVPNAGYAEHRGDEHVQCQKDHHRLSSLFQHH